MKPFSTAYHPSLHRRLRSYKEEFLRSHFGKPRNIRPGQNRRWPSIAAFYHPRANVVGIGFGAKKTDGAIVPGVCALRIYVREKLEENLVAAKHRIRPAVNGLITDVIEVGAITAAMPGMGGCSGANGRVDPGTLGALVRGRSTGSDFILSCFHVLADISDPEEGDLIYAPARQDGGTAQVGKLSAWVSLNPAGGNTMDAAIAVVDPPGGFAAGQQGIGAINTTPMVATMGQLVEKSGRVAPRLTSGTVSDISADITVQYPESAQTFGFVQQIALEGNGGVFAWRGDSGAIVLDQNSKQPIGIIFSVGTDRKGQAAGFANPIQPILDQLNVDFE